MTKLPNAEGGGVKIEIKIILMAIMWFSAALSCFNTTGSMIVPVILAIGAIFITHHIFNFPIKW